MDGRKESRKGTEAMSLTIGEFIIVLFLIITILWCQMINRKINRLHNWIAQIKYRDKEE
jgi:hypothetical protein